jgi:hypothetical protein
MVHCTATLLCGIIIAMSADWKLSLVILVVIPLMGLQGYAQVKFLEGFSQDAKVSHGLVLFSPICQFFPFYSVNSYKWIQYIPHADKKWLS